MRALRHLVSALLLTPLILFLLCDGCIAIVPSYEPKEHCEFAGDTPCATCMRTSCQAEIDACCGVSSCHESAFLGTTGTTIAGVDTCARGNAAACQTELDYATKTPEGEKVRICVEGTCKAQCAPGAIATKWTCEAPRTGEAGTCAACIYGKCNAQISSCCASGSCASYGGIDDDLSVCVGEDPLACAYRLRESTESGEAGVVRKCIREDCETQCLGDGSTHQDCRLQNGGTFCTCTAAEAKRGDECSKAKLDGGRCYEMPGGCVCGHFACTFRRDGSFPSCSCGFANAEDGGEESDQCNFDVLEAKPSAPEASCCLYFGGTSLECRCDTVRSTCSGSGVPVKTCDRDFLLNTALKPYATNVCSK